MRKQNNIPAIGSCIHRDFRFSLKMEN